MFSPERMRTKILTLCKEREERGEIVFALRIRDQIRMIPEGTVLFVPDYTLCPGRELPNVQAVAHEPLFIATDNTEEYIELATHGTFELLCNGLEEFADANYAPSQKLHDDGDIGEYYALTLPWLRVGLLDGDAPACVSANPPKQKVGRKLEFL